MELNKNKLERILKNRLANDPPFGRALGIVKANSFNGNIWLIGGAVYQTLASHIYSAPRIIKDYDFIVESPMPYPSCPPTWKIQQSTSKCPKMIDSSEKIIINFIPLKEIYSIKARSLEPNLPNFLSGTSLDIQSMAYDVNSQILEGEIGLKSLEEKTVKINNLQMAEEYTRMKGTDVKNYTLQMAKKLNFMIELI